MQLRNMLRKLSIAFLALVSLGLEKAHASSGTILYAGTTVLKDLTGQYNLYTVSDLLTNGTLATQGTLMQASLRQQTRLMDPRLTALSGKTVASTAAFSPVSKFFNQ